MQHWHASANARKKKEPGKKKAPGKKEPGKKAPANSGNESAKTPKT